jgi:hypothetical protein
VCFEMESSTPASVPLSMPIADFYNHIRSLVNDRKFSGLCSLLKSYDERRGTIKTTDPEYQYREAIIGEIVRILRNDLHNHREGNPVTEIARYVPMIASNTVEQARSEKTACRIAWEVFIIQFPENLRWAAHVDPFYEDSVTLDVDDAERISIQSSQAAAEKRYRGVIHSLRNQLRTQKDPFMTPLPLPTPLPTHQTASPPEVSVISPPPPKTDSKSSLSSAKSSMTAPNLRTMRVAVAPPVARDPAPVRGFIPRRPLTSPETRL